MTGVQTCALPISGHERVLFNRFIQAQGKKQELLIPYIITTSSNEEDSYLDSITSALDEAGFAISQREKGFWEVKSVNVQWQGNENDLEKDILEKKLNPEDLTRSIAASAACRAAVKDKDYLDTSSAIELIRQILSLEDPHCPHGRPVWTIITKEELFERVKRT